MGSPYLCKNDPQEARFIPLFHAWGDLLLSRYLALESPDQWISGLATRWTIQSAWSCFELACHLALRRDITKKSEQLSPGFWPNVNLAFAHLVPPVAPINHKQPPWDDWHLIHEERHPYAHYGAGGGRFPSKADAELAVDESEKAIARFLTLLAIPTPRWLSASSQWPKDMDTIQRGLGARGGGMFGTVTVCVQGAPESDPTTVKVVIVNLDDTESVIYYCPPGAEWKGRADLLLNGLAHPIKAIRAYDQKQVYLDEPLLMWGGQG